MKTTSTANLTREKLRKLLAAAKSGVPEQPPAEATEYNWNQPRHFSGSQLKKLIEFAQKMNQLIAHKLAAMCNTDFAPQTVSVTQHFGNEFITTSQAEQKNFLLAFATENQRPVGFLSLARKPAIGWVSKLLGETNAAPDESKTLSRLEQSFLMDITSAIIGVFSDISKKNKNGHTFTPVGPVAGDECPIILSPLDELCKITCPIQQSDETAEVCFVILAEALEPPAGMDAQTDSTTSAQELHKRILSCLKQVHITAEAILGSTNLTVQEIADLQPGDILLLDNTIDQPVEVDVEGRPFFYGRAAKSAGKFAVVITKSKYP